MNPQKKFHLVFSALMAGIMVFIMTFVITLANVGWVEHFYRLWMRAFGFAYVVAAPLIFFLAPLVRKLTGRLLGMQA